MGRAGPQVDDSRAFDPPGRREVRYWSLIDGLLLARPVAARSRVFVEQSVSAARTSVARYMRGPPDVVGDSRDQAHLPAEQPASRQDPWLPSAHAYPCGPRDPRGPSPQGPRGALGLTSPSVLPAAHRMRR